MFAMVCKHCGVVKISRHYRVAMGLCRVGPCLPVDKLYDLINNLHDPTNDLLYNTGNRLDSIDILHNISDNLCDPTDTLPGLIDNIHDPYPLSTDNLSDPVVIRSEVEFLFQIF